MTRSPNRIVGSIAGGVFVVLGALGLFGVLEPRPGFPVLGVLHVLLGAALLLAALSGLGYAKAVNPWVGALFLVLGLAGLFLVDSTVNVLSVSLTDNVLHFAAAVALLAVGLGAETPARTKAAH